MGKVEKMKKLELEGRSVWVIGASSGIGEALAMELAEGGARLLLSGRHMRELERVAWRCLAAGANADAYPLDLSATATLDRTVDRCLEILGTPDLLVLASEISQRSPAAETTVEVDRRLMEVSCFGPIAVTRRVLPSMIARGSGHILVLSSLVGKLGTPSRSDHAASRHALHGFFDSLRAEVHDRGIGVSLCCPGDIQTDTLRSLTGDGSASGRGDDALERGMPAGECARRILEDLRRGEPAL